MVLDIMGDGGETAGGVNNCLVLYQQSSDGI